MRIEGPRHSMGFSFGMPGGSSNPIEPTDPLRIVVVGDFSARASRNSVESLRGRAPIEISEIGVDGLIDRLQPRVSVLGADVSLSSLDDLHPDHLQRLAPPTPSADSSQAATEAPFETTSGPDERSGSAFGGLLGAEAGSKPADAVQDAVSKMISSAMKGSKAPEPTRADGSDHAWLRRVLEDPGFRETELAWRALHWFETRVEVGEHATLHALDASSAEISNALDAASWEQELDPLFVGRASDERPGLVVLLHSFHATVEDMVRLQRLATAASVAGVPVVVGMDCAILGCHRIAETPDSTAWDPAAVDPNVRSAWDELRASEAARSLVIAAPRVMLRAPFGSDNEPTDIAGFSEVAAAKPPEHESLCWAPGSLAVGVGIAAGIGYAGRGIALAGTTEVDQLPMHTVTIDRDQHVVPPAETWLSDRSLEHMSREGFTPIGSLRHRDAVRIGPIRSVAGPLRAWWQHD